MHFHDWIYNTNKDYRVCPKCNREEKYIEGAAVSGMADDSYWTKITKQSQK